MIWGGIFCTIVYAYNSANHRTPLWQDLQNIGKHITGPWILLGDFNTVLHQDERINYAGPVGADTRELQTLYSDLFLTDLHYGGNQLTWWGKLEYTAR